MSKKDIYEHLADIYWDASSKKRKKAEKYPKKFKSLFFISIAATLFLATALLIILKEKNTFLNSEIALVVSPEVVKINFHFDPARKESYSLDLNKLNLKRFNTLAFSAKRANFKDNIALRIEFTNAFKEKSEVYLKDIPHRWHDYKISFPEFKNISDWSNMTGLAFIIEEWNVKEKKGIVYLDNVRFLR
ncbi:MAG: hypothetical protein COX40_00090 [Candidatus Omnitrophica bacterium CG23_combo_of_CG06-09_8_20_14_all_40_11]|nr:MAG: hypothetical protein COX40_00090 [Candidatus Omnitrophica bacterium CG23_combo_of_CG06-09_8_20_14_all_40_11]